MSDADATRSSDTPGGPGATARTVASAAEDAALVQACLSSAPGAWDAFVARFAGLFHHVVDRTCSQRRLAPSASDRDDVVAEILVEVLKGDAAVLRGFGGKSSLATYLAVVARRTTLRMLGRSQPLAPDRTPHQSREAPDRHAEHRRADREEVESLMIHLSPEEAKLVRLHHLEARSYGEISRITGMPLGSIGPALSRARQKMRDAGQPHPDAGPLAAG